MLLLSYELCCNLYHTAACSYCVTRSSGSPCHSGCKAMGRSLSPVDRHSSRKEHKEHKKHKDKDRERDRDRERGRDRDRDRKDKDRDRDRDRERSKRHHDDRDRDRDRDKRSKRSRHSRSRSESASRSRSRTRSPKRRTLAATPSAPVSDTAVLQPSRSAAAAAVSVAAAQHVDTTGLSAEDAAKKRREAEAAELDAEIERRRKRVAEWRAKRLAEQNGDAQDGADTTITSPQGPGAAAAVDSGAQPSQPDAAAGGSTQGDGVAVGGDMAADGDGEGDADEDIGVGDQEEDLVARSRHRARKKLRTRRAGAGEEGWLEDEEGLEDDEENNMQVDGQEVEGDAVDHLSLDTPAHLKPRRKAADEDDDEDPLDAFMKLNQPSAAKAAAVALQGKQQMLGAAGADEDGEEDPLDAFMKGNDAAVAKLQQDEAQKPGPMNEDGEDPLEAFVASNVMPKVKASTPGPTSEDMDQEPQQPHIKAETDNAHSVAARVVATSDSKAGYAEGSEAYSGGSLKTEPGREGSVGPVASTSTAAISRGGSKMLLQNKALLPVALTGKPGLGAVQRPGLAAKPRRSRMYSSSESESDTSDEEQASEEEDDVAWAQRVNAGKLSKGDKLGQVDHAQVEYAPFRKAFYIEVPELAKMNVKEVAALRKELDGIKVRGNNVPKPIRAWTQAGLSTKVIDLLKKSGCMSPLPIQAQALPIIMSGRDCIGIAKTGSGKTLAYVLPLLRHVKDQPPLQQGDGPIGLIMAPTRELVQQISKEVKKYAKMLGVECTAVFGGQGIGNQISELKRGSEVVVCTPGRMIDLLVTSNGKITNVRRVTYLVLDEADRMFDMGFEPQIMRIINNVRPDRQTVLFSATFPFGVEALARKVLDNPCEIQVGGRSVVNSDITQIVEIRPEADRFLRLLEILGEWYERGKIIIFVQSQEKCDTLFRDLLRNSYPCLSLHGGKDQGDRESTIADFKGAVCSVLVATSVAARGLDVPQLVLVVNYDCPNHHEDYVHRVGRTGRAGQKGTAITFIAPEEEKYAPDLVKAFKESNAPIPQDLQDLADSFNAKRKAGLATGHGSGFGGSGFKFDAEEADRVKANRKQAAKDYGVEVGEESESDGDDIRVAAGAVGAGGEGGDSAATAAAAAAAAAAVAVQARQGNTSQPSVPGPVTAANPQLQEAINAAISRMSSQQQQPAPGQPPGGLPPAVPSSVNANLQGVLARIQASAPPGTSISLQPPSQPPMSTPAQPPSAAGLLQQPPMPAFPGMAAPAQPPVSAAVLAAQQAAAAIAASRGVGTGPTGGGSTVNAAVAAALAAIPGVQLAGASAPPPPPVALPPPLPLVSSATNPEAARDAAAKAAQLASLFATRTGAQQAGAPGTAGAAAGIPGPPEMHYEAELEINDFPQHSRWKVTHRDTVNMIAETTGAAIITKGVFVPPGQKCPEGERKIYLLIEGPTEKSVKQAKQELKRILEETTEKVMRRDAPAGMGRYSVM